MEKRILQSVVAAPKKTVSRTSVRSPFATTLCLCFSAFLFDGCLDRVLDTKTTNDPPKFTLEKFGPDTVRTGDAVSFILQTQDNDNDPITLSTLDTSFSIVDDTISWRPARSDTGWKTITVYAHDQKGGVDTILCRFFVVFYNHYHLVATLSDSLELNYGSIQETCSGRCGMAGLIWEATYSKGSWDNGDKPSRISRAFGFYDNGYDEFPEYRSKACELQVRVDSVKIGSDSIFFRMHQDDPCQPFTKMDDYYLSGLGLFYSITTDSNFNSIRTNYYPKGVSAPILYPYVSTIDSLLKETQD